MSEQLHIIEFPSPRFWGNHCRRELVRKWKRQWPDWAGHRYSGEPFKLEQCDLDYLKQWRSDATRQCGESIVMLARQKNANFEVRIVNRLPRGFY